MPRRAVLRTTLRELRRSEPQTAVPQTAVPLAAEPQTAEPIAQLQAPTSCRAHTNRRT